jgi:hypothetical protein
VDISVKTLRTQSHDHAVVRGEGLLVDLAALALDKAVNKDSLVDLGTQLPRIAAARVGASERTVDD